MFSVLAVCQFVQREGSHVTIINDVIGHSQVTWDPLHKHIGKQAVGLRMKDKWMANIKHDIIAFAFTFV